MTGCRRWPTPGPERAGALRAQLPTTSERPVSAKGILARLRARRCAPTARGWALLGAGALAGLAGLLLGMAELDGLAAAAAIAVLTAWAWTARQGYHLEVRRHLHPLQPAPGKRNLVEFQVENAGARRTPVLSLHDPLTAARAGGGGGGGAHKLLAPLGVGEARTWSYELVGLRRGSFVIGPLGTEVEDPLGLARKRTPVGEPTRVVVHPRVHPLRTPVLARRSHQEGISGAGRDGTEDLSGLREYVPGDDVRRIHWASSARADKVLVREERVEDLGRVVVVLDLRRSSWAEASPDDALELALEAAASVAADACARGLQVRLLATDGTDSGIGSSPRHCSRILDWLASAGPHPGDALFGPRASETAGPNGVPASALAASDHTVVCTSDRAAPEDFRGALHQRRRAPLTVVVADTGGARRHGPPPGAHVVRVGPGRDLTSTWQQGAPR